MSLLKNFIKSYRAKFLLSLQSYGFNIYRINGIDKQIIKLRKIKDSNARLHFAEQLVCAYPENPKFQLELVKCMHQVNDMRQFSQMNKYANIFQKWLSHNKLAMLGDIEFIEIGMVVGSFGNHFAIEGLLRANQYGLRKAKNLILLMPENTKLRNPVLFSYFEPYIQVIKDEESIQAMKGLELLFTLPLGIGLPMNDICPFLDIAANMAEVERIKLGLDYPLFDLNEVHSDIGKQVLKKIGLPNDAWYVTLHVREPGYRGESKTGTSEAHRNANPLDYLKACKAITDAGGWVFRMGDTSMTPLPKMSQVIDYAHMDIRSDLMDIFLGATCQFLIGTASGYLRVPRYFGVPVIFTNCTSSNPYFSLVEYDLYLPRLLKYQENNKYMSFKEYMSPSISMLYSIDQILNEGLEWVENTPEELEDVTIEMLAKIDSKNTLNPKDDLQKRFKIIAENGGLKYGDHPVKAFASVSKNFLQKHFDLLE